MATRWALVGLLALAAVGCSGSENGRYVAMPLGGGVLDTRTGRVCFPVNRLANDNPYRSFTYEASCLDLGENYEEYERQRSTPDTTARP